jgi:hypothetical protein
VCQPPKNIHLGINEVCNDSDDARWWEKFEFEKRIEFEFVTSKKIRI